MYGKGKFVYLALPTKTTPNIAHHNFHLTSIRKGASATNLT